MSIGAFETRIPNITQTIADGDNKALGIGSFDYSNAVYKAGYTYSVSQTLHTGFALSYYRHDLYQTLGQGINADLGVIQTFNKGSVALGIQNVFRNMSVSYSNGGSEKLPLYTALSGSYDLTSEVTVMSQLKMHNLGDQYLKAAGIQIKPAFLNGVLTVSCGWQEFLVLNAIQNKMAFGMGLRLQPATLHFAYEGADDTDSNSHYATSLTFDF